MFQATWIVVYFNQELDKQKHSRENLLSCAAISCCCCLLRARLVSSWNLEIMVVNPA